MSKSNFFENALLNDVYHSGTYVSSLGANLWVALYTADPGEAGTATTSEATYTGYARQAVSRTTGFTVAGNSVSPAANVTFPACSGGTNAITHWAIVDSASGAGNILHSGTVTPNIAVSTPIAPILTTASTITED